MSSAFVDTGTSLRPWKMSPPSLLDAERSTMGARPCSRSTHRSSMSSIAETCSAYDWPEEPPLAMRSKSASMASGVSPGFSSVPSIVNVLPLPVDPYAISVTSKPLSTP